MEPDDSKVAPMTPLSSVSIVIPTRDRPRLLKNAVESVLQQTYPVEQIVIVDDGSAAENAVQIDALASAHPAIEIHRSASQGVSAARNLGLKHARGDYVLFLDDDDLIHPRLCEDGVAILQRGNADAVVFLYECFFTPGGHPEAYSSALFSAQGNFSHTPLARTTAAGNPVPAWFLEAHPASSFLRYLIPIHSCLLRRDKIGRVQFPQSLTQGEDTYFWIELATKGLRFVSDPHVYAYIHRHSGNATRSHSQYRREIQPCYESLIASGLLRDPRDRYLVDLKLCWFKMVTRRRGSQNHLRRIVVAPSLLARELGFWMSNFRRRRRLIGYYFSR
jgi:glycosyltransferase involved in cell wall biosynthesis